MARAETSPTPYGTLRAFRAEVFRGVPDRVSPKSGGARECPGSVSEALRAPGCLIVQDVI